MWKTLNFSGLLLNPMGSAELLMDNAELPEGNAELYVDNTKFSLDNAELNGKRGTFWENVELYVVIIMKKGAISFVPERRSI